MENKENTQSGGGDTVHFDLDVKNISVDSLEHFEPMDKHQEPSKDDNNVEIKTEETTTNTSGPFQVDRKESCDNSMSTGIADQSMGPALTSERSQEEDFSPKQLLNRTERASQDHLQQTFQTAAGNSLLLDITPNNDNENDHNTKQQKVTEEIMEFAKNYSDELLMSQTSEVAAGQRASDPTSGSADLADFELPPYSGSSSGSGSEQPFNSTNKQPSPAKRKSSSASSNTQPSSSNEKQTGITPPDLYAVKKLLISSYSRGSHVFLWRNPIESAVFFAIGNGILLALTFFSIISVVAYSALSVMLVSGLVRVYKVGMKMLNKSPDLPCDHIWNKVLNLNVTMSPENMHELVDSSHGNLNASLVYFKQVLLIEDKLATFKFGIFLYLLTYIGSWFNGMTLFTLCFYALFSVPIFYEKNKTNIDDNFNAAYSKFSSAISMVTDRVSSLALGSSPSKKQD